MWSFLFVLKTMFLSITHLQYNLLSKCHLIYANRPKKCSWTILLFRQMILQVMLTITLRLTREISLVCQQYVISNILFFIYNLSIAFFAFFAFKHEVSKKHIFPNVEYSFILLQLQMFCCKILANIIGKKKKLSFIFSFIVVRERDFPMCWAS